MYLDYVNLRDFSFSSIIMDLFIVSKKYLKTENLNCLQ